MNDELKFKKEVETRIAQQGKYPDALDAAEAFLAASLKTKYIYNFSWLGRPIIQTPQDLVALQEIIFRIRPDLIVDVGVARGGSVVFFASLLELNALYGGSASAKVLGVEIDLKGHNREAISASPLSKRIDILDGSSLDSDVIKSVSKYVESANTILVCLDSLHTHDHVLAELKAYSKFVSRGSYCVVFDTSIEGMDDSLFTDRPWRTGNSPGSAIKEFLTTSTEFAIDVSIDSQLLISMNKNGYLKKT